MWWHQSSVREIRQSFRHVWRLPSNLTMYYIASSDKCLTFHCHISRTLPKSTMEGPSTFQTSHKSWPPWSCQSTCSVSAWTRPCSVTPGCLGMQWAEPGIHWTPDAHAGLEYTTWCVNTWDTSITPTQATPNSSVCFTWFFFLLIHGAPKGCQDCQDYKVTWKPKTKTDGKYCCSFSSRTSPPLVLVYLPKAP